MGVSIDELHAGVGWAALACSYVLYFSILPEMIEVQKTRHLGERSIVPYVSLLVNGSLWTIYGAYTGDFIVFITNITGCLCGLCYTSIYLANSKERSETRAFAVIVTTAGAFVISMVGLIAFSRWFNQNETKGLVGVICAVFNVGLYASPLALFATVIKNKSTSGMSFPLSLTICGATILWTTYAALGGDVNILVPSAIGVACALVQLSLFYFYGLPRTLRRAWTSALKGKPVEVLPLLSLGNHPLSSLSLASMDESTSLRVPMTAAASPMSGDEEAGRGPGGNDDDDQPLFAPGHDGMHAAQLMAGML